MKLKIPKLKSTLRKFDKLSTPAKVAIAVLGVLAVKTLFGGASRGYPGPSLTPGQQFKPGSAKQVQLFEAAAREAGLPESWASDSDFQTLLKRESSGMVGIPNYTYGALKNDPSKWPLVWQQLRAGIKTTSSSATGLGQLTLPNVDAFYPDLRLGIGDARNEAIGMLRYIKKRYGTPQAAREFHDEKHWY